MVVGMVEVVAVVPNKDVVVVVIVVPFVVVVPVVAVLSHRHPSRNSSHWPDWREVTARLPPLVVPRGPFQSQLQPFERHFHGERCTWFEIPLDLDAAWIELVLDQAHSPSAFCLPPQSRIRSEDSCID